MDALTVVLAIIHSAATDILAFVQGLDEAAFVNLPDTDRRTYRAVENALADLCGTIRQLPTRILARHPHIDWRGFIELSAVATNPKFTNRLPWFWPVVVNEVPALLIVIQAELEHLIGPSKPPKQSNQLNLSPVAWRHFVAELQEVKRLSLSNAKHPQDWFDLQASMQVVLALHKLLQAHPDLASRQLDAPVSKLLSAFSDLSQGHRPDLFKPMPRPKHKGVASQILMAIAALALEEMVVNLSEPLILSSERIARIIAATKLPVRPRGEAQLASTVRGWRDRLREGQDSAYPIALHIWQDYHDNPSKYGASPTERVSWLLNRIRHGVGLRWR